MGLSIPLAFFNLNIYGDTTTSITIGNIEQCWKAQEQKQRYTCYDQCEQEASEKYEKSDSPAYRELLQPCMQKCVEEQLDVESQSGCIEKNMEKDTELCGRLQKPTVTGSDIAEDLGSLLREGAWTQMDEETLKHEIRQYFSGDEVDTVASGILSNCEKQPPAEAEKGPKLWFAHEMMAKLNQALSKSDEVQAKADFWVEELKGEMNRKRGAANRARKSFDAIPPEYRMSGGLTAEEQAKAQEAEHAYQRLASAETSQKKTASQLYRARRLSDKIGDSRTDLIFLKRCFMGAVKDVGGGQKFSEERGGDYFTNINGYIETKKQALEKEGGQIPVEAPPAEVEKLQEPRKSGEVENFAIRQGDSGYENCQKLLEDIQKGKP